MEVQCLSCAQGLDYPYPGIKRYGERLSLEALGLNFVLDDKIEGPVLLRAMKMVEDVQIVDVGGRDIERNTHIGVSNHSQPKDSTVFLENSATRSFQLESHGEVGCYGDLDKSKISDPLKEGAVCTNEKGSEECSNTSSKLRQRPVTFIEKPDWLPEGWTAEVRTREAGNTAGTKDKYYMESSTRRRFRSKIEVMQYLETGEIPRWKKKYRSRADPSSSKGATPSSSMQMPIKQNDAQENWLELGLCRRSVQAPFGLGSETTLECLKIKETIGDRSLLKGDEPSQTESSKQTTHDTAQIDIRKPLDAFAPIALESIRLAEIQPLLPAFLPVPGNGEPKKAAVTNTMPKKAAVTNTMLSMKTERPLLNLNQDPVDEGQETSSDIEATKLSQVRIEFEKSNEQSQNVVGTSFSLPTSRFHRDRLLSNNIATSSAFQMPIHSSPEPSFIGTQLLTMRTDGLGSINAPRMTFMEKLLMPLDLTGKGVKEAVREMFPFFSSSQAGALQGFWSSEENNSPQHHHPGTEYGQQRLKSKAPNSYDGPSASHKINTEVRVRRNKKIEKYQERKRLEMLGKKLCQDGLHCLLEDLKGGRRANLFIKKVQPAGTNTTV